jgi:hypothetical protein
VPRRAAIVAAAVGLVAAALLISWAFALAGLVIGALVVVTRRPLLGALTAAALAALLGIIVWYRNRTERFFVNAGWPGHFADLHRWGLLVVVLLLVSVAVAPPAGAAADDPELSRPDGRSDRGGATGPG